MGNGWLKLKEILKKNLFLAGQKKSRSDCLGQANNYNCFWASEKRSSVAWWASEVSQLSCNSE